MSETGHHKIAVVGAGSIGTAFAIVFARAGFPITLYDPDDQRLISAISEIAERLGYLTKEGLLDEDHARIHQRIAVTSSMTDAVSGAVHIQECAPELLDVKRNLFAEIDEVAPPKAVIASSSSAMPASQYTDDLAGRARCLVAHPTNPPYLIPMIEIVPAPWTDADATQRTLDLFRAARMSPVLVNKEIEGFLLNRLQGAVLREAYCLVRDGIASAEDIDTVMRDGLGMRWCWIGPFETVDLNTRGGIASHAIKMGPAYARMGKERGQNDPWTEDLVAKVAGSRRKALPLDKWSERVAWRDRALMALLRLRKSFAE
jgi:L-gulonate 3-dehydrogenase